MIELGMFVFFGMFAVAAIITVGLLVFAALGFALAIVAGGLEALGRALLDSCPRRGGCGAPPAPGGSSSRRRRRAHRRRMEPAPSGSDGGWRRDGGDLGSSRLATSP
jgi:hypothetical protein